MKTYNLYSFLKEELKNGSSDLVTRPSGQVMRERIEKEIQQESDGRLEIFDYCSGVDCQQHSVVEVA